MSALSDRLVELLKTLPANTEISWSCDRAVADCFILSDQLDIYIPYLQTQLNAFWLWTITPDQNTTNELEISLPYTEDVLLSVRDGWVVKAEHLGKQIPATAWQRHGVNWHLNAISLGKAAYDIEQWRTRAYHADNISNALETWVKLLAKRTDLSFKYNPNMIVNISLSSEQTKMRGQFLNELAASRTVQEREQLRLSAQKILNDLSMEQFEQQAIFFCSWCGQIMIEDYDHNLQEPESIICECGEWLMRLGWGDPLPPV